MEKEQKATVKDLSISFAQDLITILKKSSSKHNFINSDQLLRSGTSIGANICEAQSAESRKDFIHKMKVAAKEAEETEYWLCLNSKNIDEQIVSPLQDKIVSIKKMLSKIISTSIKNSKPQKNFVRNRHSDKYGKC